MEDIHQVPGIISKTLVSLPVIYMETIIGVVHTHYHLVIITLMELFLLVQEVLQLQHVLRNVLHNITNHMQVINSTVLVHIQLQVFKI